MKAQLACMESTRLVGYLRGELVGVEADAVEAHLSGCPACFDRIRVLETGDVFYQAMNKSVSPAAGTLQPERYAALQHQLKELKPQALIDTDNGGNTGTGSDRYPTKAGPLDEAAQKLLTPPQRPDELGRIAKYRILEKLGQGGMGMVFRAEDTDLKRQVALKVLLPEFADCPNAKQRFLREARAAAALEHENIVPIFQVGEERGHPFLAMQLLKGQTLESWLRQRRQRGQHPPAQLSEALVIASWIGKGLMAAHARNLVHRDIKPGNVWLDSKARGLAKILDFGLVLPVRDTEEKPLTITGEFMGTPAYMAPEQAEGETVDARADLFSLGCVLYELTTGISPFRRKTAAATLLALSTAHPKPPHECQPSIPRAVSDFIMRLLAKDPKQRPQSAQEVVETLAEFKQQAAAPPAKTPEIRAAQPKRRRAWLVAAAVLLTLLATSPFWGPWTIRFARNQSEVVIEADQDVEVTLLQGGQKIKVLDSKTQRTFEITPGEYEFTLRELPNGVELRGQKIALHRGARAVLNAAMELTQAKKSGHETDPLPTTFINSFGMKFVLVGRGTAWLGGSEGAMGKKLDIPDDFYLGVYEVTQGEWFELVGTEPSHFGRLNSGASKVKEMSDTDLKRFPVETVSWDQTQVFLHRLNARENSAGWTYRLPTEVEWEYACRAGPLCHELESAFDFYFDVPTNQLLPEKANFGHSAGLGRTSKVGSFPPNRLGLYDMHGNVFEWCHDKLAGKDGTSMRVYRGGSWDSPHAKHCRASSAAESEAGGHGRTRGFRVAKVRSGQQ